MSTENKNTPEHKDLAVGEVITNAEHFIEKNQKIILIVIAAIVLVIGGYFGYKKLYAEPREATAAAELFAAEQYFKNDDMEKALKGDGKNLGLVAFIDKYGSTKSGNLANFYAGCAYMSKGEFQKAIDFLEDFNAEDAFLGNQSKSLIGDCYMELNKVDDAINSYNKALENPNDMTTPFNLYKLGLAYEVKKDNAKALEAYKKIKTDFPNSAEAREIEKYIVRLENL
ncbi:MAG: Tetratricopeptide repeat-containing protein [Bacteroidetes bacterium]|nr:Tetratricopeptide repeat-containing protein [Bacteroidota bacterium]